jgi:thiosulfate reductase cytochrome b subunit
LATVEKLGHAVSQLDARKQSGGIQGMTTGLDKQERTSGVPRHALWVRFSHWLWAVSFLTLAFSGFVILMAHPRLYWGEVGNDLMPALLELPISRNYQHDGWDKPTPIFQDAAGPVSASRTYEIFNANGWARSLHFLAAWCLVLPGLLYLLRGIFSGHFRRNIWPRFKELAPHLVWRDVVDHLRLRFAEAGDKPVTHYGLLQKCAYSLVIFLAVPLMVLAGLSMSPAVTADFPSLLSVFGGYQTARTIHFFTFVALVLFLLVHVAMVVLSGFRRQMRAMTVGE